MKRGTENEKTQTENQDFNFQDIVLCIKLRDNIHGSANELCKESGNHTNNTQSS